MPNDCRKLRNRLAPVAVAAFLVFEVAASTYGAAAEEHCDVTSAGKADNAKLSFQAFDQAGTLPSTWRALDNRHCYGAAIEAMESYLVEGPVGTPEERSDLLFHLGQSLGMAGRNQEAALVIAGARRGGIEPDGFDWETYVVGTWAYFVRDKTRLGTMRDKLDREPGRGNKLNTTALTGLMECFDQPYETAYSKACRGHPTTGPAAAP